MVQATEFNVDAELSRIQEDSVIASLNTFLEVNNPFEIRVTTAQQICNMNDHKDVALVLDMRSNKVFNNQNLSKSVNFGLERFREDTFINWKTKTKQLE